MKKILIDTNFFFLFVDKKIDIISEIQRVVEEKFCMDIEDFYTLRKNIWELEHLRNTAKSEKMRRKINLISKYINLHKIKIIETSINERTDRLIVNTVVQNPGRWIVATNDRNLREVLRRLDIRVIYEKMGKLFII